MRTIILLLFLLFARLLSLAQVITLDEYTQRVINYNQDLKIAGENIAAAAAAVRSSKTGLLPRLDADAGFNYQFDPSPVLSTKLKNESWSANLALTQAVYNGLALSNQVALAELQSQISGMAREATREQVIYSSWLLYWNTSANQEYNQLSQEYYELVKQLHDVVKIRFEDGLISRTDLLQLETRLAEAELQVSRTDMAYRIVRQQLNTLMGVAVDSLIGVDKINSSMDISITPAAANVETGRPAYRIAMKNTEVADVRTQLAKSRFLPQLNIGIQESWGTGFINLDNSTQFSTVAFAQLNVPVFAWNNRKHVLTQTRVAEKNSEFELQKIKDQLNLELSNASTSLNQSSSQLEIAIRNLETASENLEISVLSYNEGRLPILDVLSSQLSWLQAYTNLVSSHLTNKVAVGDYLRASGVFAAVTNTN
jgi:outer membrane protein